MAVFWSGIVLCKDVWLVSADESSEKEWYFGGVLRGIRYHGDSDITVLCS